MHSATMKLIIYVTSLLTFLQHPAFAASDSCPVTQYSGSFKAKKHEENKAIVGCSYKNVTITFIQECFSRCLSDCECLSYQISGTRCELLDEDKLTFPSRFKSVFGYKYYQLKQHFKDKEVSCSGGCRNGCCHTNPCLNGGTCIEVCEDVKRKFKCICPLGIKGRRCQFVISCAGIPGNPDSGIYTITRPSLTSQFKVYCDFTSEPNFVWTLVESFEYSLKPKYYTKHFLENFPVSESSPNWIDYRLTEADMRHIRTNATHWRATCNFQTNLNLSTTDYVKVDMKTQDLLQKTPSKCFEFGFLKTMGTTCNGNCGIAFRHDDYHPYFMPCYEIACQVGACLGVQRYSELFGAYDKLEPSHPCSLSPSNTTNWWIGYKFEN